MGQEKTVLALALEAEAADGLFGRQQTGETYFVVSRPDDSPWDKETKIVGCYDTMKAATDEARRRKHLQPHRRFGVAPFSAEALITQSPITMVEAERSTGEAR